jgi:Arc/MetJ-type ribon-helix-helix transcriptional regulator
MIPSGRYNKRSKAVRPGLRSLQEQEIGQETQRFEKIFAGGRAGEPGTKTIRRIVAHQEAHRKARR